MTDRPACRSLSPSLLVAFALLGATHALAEADALKAERPNGSSARLATDPPLRQGMAAVRRLVLAHATLVSHRRLPLDAARRLSADLKGAVAAIRAATTLPPSALATLAAILASIDVGADAIAGKATGRDAMDGMADIDAALARYGEQFDDPEWTPLR